MNTAELETFFSPRTNIGYLSDEARARIDELRVRANGGRQLSVSSEDIIKEARGSRTQEAPDDSGNIEP